MASADGPRASDARQVLAEELYRWQRDPRKHGKVSRKLAKQIAEGPPGPQRTAWQAFEAAAAILTAALARKAVERFLSASRPGASRRSTPPAPQAAPPTDPKHAKDDVTKPPADRAAAAAYSGISSRDRAEPRSSEALRHRGGRARRRGRGPMACMGLPLRWLVRGASERRVHVTARSALCKDPAPPRSGGISPHARTDEARPDEGAAVPAARLGFIAGYFAWNAPMSSVSRAGPEGPGPPCP